MDKTPEYKNMSKDVDSIQESYIGKALKSPVSVIGLWVWDKKDPFIIDKPYNKRKLKGLTYIPRQCETQELLGINVSTNGMGKFENFCFDMCLDFNDIFDDGPTYEKLWLMYYTIKKHNKLWNGKYWSHLGGFKIQKK